MKKILISVIMLIILASFISAETCTICNETCSPCGGGCTATDLTAMYQNVVNFDQAYGDITGWNTSCITSMSKMFKGAKDFNQDIGRWDTSKVKDMSQMFGYGSIFNQDISGWNTSSLTNTSTMFYNNFYFNQPIGNWDTHNIISMNNMFFRAKAFNQDISGWNTSKVITMYSTFAYTENFNQPIGSWDVSNVVDMSGMFGFAHAFDQDLNAWNVSSAKKMINMFAASGFNHPLDRWDVSNAVDLSYMFDNNTVFDQDLGSWNTGNVNNLVGFFGEDQPQYGSAKINISTKNYDALLNGWSGKQQQMGVIFDGGNSQYSKRGLIGRDILVNRYGWIIHDGGMAPCTENWISQDSVCNGFNYTIIYVDINECGTAMNLPSDNGTAVACSLDTDGDGVSDGSDICPLTDSTGFDADHDGCIDTINGLQQVILTLPPEAISDNIRNSLTSKVDNALKSTDKENDIAAVNMLNDFINGIEAQRGNKISIEAADMLIIYAHNVIAQILVG